MDWPHKAESKSYFPPKGKDDHSVGLLVCLGSVLEWLQGIDEPSVS